MRLRGGFRAELTPGPCVVTLLSMGVPVDYVRLVVPDSDVSLRVAFEAALAADVGDRGVLERLAAEAVASASAFSESSAASAASAGESARFAERSAEAAAAASEDSAREGAGSVEAAKAASGTAESAAGRAETAAEGTRVDAEAAGVSAANAAADADRAKAEADRAHQIAGGDFAPTEHTHTVEDITDLPELATIGKPNTVPVREYDSMIRVDHSKPHKTPGI